MNLFNAEMNLATKYPRLAEEWDFELNNPERPEDCAPYTTAEFWWKCKNNHRWIATANNRAKGQNCPWCYGNHPYRGKLIWIKTY